MCQISPASVCSFKEYLPPLNISNSCQPAALFFVISLHTGPCNSLHNCVFVRPNKGQAWVNRVASYWGVALHVAEVQLLASTKRPRFEIKWIDLFMSACGRSYLQHGRAALVCVQRLSKHTPHICQQIRTFRGSAQCYICSPSSNQRPLQMIINALWKAPGGPRRKRGCEGTPPVPHLFPPAASARIDTQSNFKQSVTFRRTWAAKLLIPLSFFLLPNWTNVPFTPAMTCSGPEWVMAFLADCKFYFWKIPRNGNWSFSICRIFAVFRIRTLTSQFNLTLVNVWPTSTSSKFKHKSCSVFFFFCFLFSEPL